jgi:tetratricopeptide (TPR) repeat protein
MMAFNKAEKSRYKKSALKGLSVMQSNLSNQGKVAYQAQDYKKAYDAFAKGIEVHNFLEANGGTSLMMGDLINDEKFFAGLTALLNEDYPNAKKYYEELYNTEGYDDASIYDGLAKIAMQEKDMSTAENYLNEGREAFPEDKALLFSQINLYLQANKLDVLMASLDEGIAADPENPSLYLVKSQTYETLYNQSLEAGEPDNAKFDAAIATLEKGLEMAPDDAKLTYAIGLLQFNRGATMSQELQLLADDLSKEGVKKYDAMLKTVDAQFEKALPYFQKAEMADPNDQSTLQALKAMYARKDMIEVSNVFKERLETVQAGGENKTSYFKEKGM